MSRLAVQQEASGLRAGTHFKGVVRFNCEAPAHRAGASRIGIKRHLLRSRPKSEGQPAMLGEAVSPMDGRAALPSVHKSGRFLILENISFLHIAVKTGGKRGICLPFPFLPTPVPDARLSQ